MSTVYGLQSTIYITFDNNHLPSTIVSNSTTVATYTFNGVNAPVTKALGNNVSLNIEYNNRYQIKKHDWKLNGNTITGYNYGHDSVGNRLYSENLVAASKSEHFVFDNADRLTSFKTGTLNANKDNIVTPTYSQSWNLDSIGNWAGFTDNGTSSTNTFSDTHEMTQFKGVTQTFDNNGNLTSDGVRAFKYDAFNRIIEVKIGTIILAEYQYDAFNRRVMKKVDADLNSSFETTIKFLYDGFRCIEELNGSDVLVQDYVYGSLYIDEVILQRSGATDYYFTHDYRYSVTNLTNTAGTIVESYDYKVYGERTFTGSGLTTIGYTGQRHDVETGLMYFKNRYYSTSMGSFVTRDPLGYVDGLSMYLGYFGARGRDPFGFNEELIESLSKNKFSEYKTDPKNLTKENIFDSFLYGLNSGSKNFYALKELETNETYMLTSSFDKSNFSSKLIDKGFSPASANTISDAYSLVQPILPVLDLANSSFGGYLQFNNPIGQTSISANKYGGYIYHAYSYESDLTSKINLNLDIGLGNRIDFDTGNNYFGAFYKLKMKAKISSKCAISLEGTHDIVGKSGGALFSDIKAYAKVAFNDHFYAKFGVEKAGLINEFSQTRATPVAYLGYEKWGAVFVKQVGYSRKDWEVGVEFNVLSLYKGKLSKGGNYDYSSVADEISGGATSLQESLFK